MLLQIKTMQPVTENYASSLCQPLWSLIAFIFPLLFASKLHAQSVTSPIAWQPKDEIRFYTYPAFANPLQGITQDKYGYIWFGSQDGLYRFDGVTCKKFVHNYTSNSLASNDCIPLFTDSRGILWIHTNIGLTMLNTNTYHFTNILFADSLFNDVISGVVEDGHQHIWLSSFGKKNLTEYDAVENKFTPYQIPDSLYRKGLRTFGLSINKDGKIYLAADGTVFVFNPATKNYETSIRSVYPASIDKKLAAEITHQTIFSNSKGDIYVGDWGFDKYFPINVYNNTKKSIIFSAPASPDRFTIVFCIKEKSDSELWLGTNTGLFIFNTKTNQYRKCEHIPDDHFSFPFLTGCVNYIFTDRQGCTWFAADKMIVKDDPQDQGIKEYDLNKTFGISGINSDFFIYAAGQTNDKKLLINTWGGAGSFIIDENKNEFTANTTYGDKNHIKKFLCRMIDDKKGNIWSFNAYQIFHYNAAQNKFIAYPVDFSKALPLAEKFCFISIMKDRRGHLWLGTYRHGVIDFNPQDLSYKYYPHNAYNKIEDPGVDFMSPQFEDDNGNIWFSSYDGVYLLNNASQNFTRLSYHAEDKIYNDGRALLKDHAGNIWRTTNIGGFQKYNAKKKLFELVRTNIDTRQVRLDAMLEDNAGCIWIDNNSEILCYNPQNNTFIIPAQDMNLDIGNALAGFSDNGMLYSARDGILYQVNTSFFHQSSETTNILFNNFKILNRDTLFTKNLNEIDEIVLPHNKNYISIEFSTINFSHSENNQYAYMLTEEDKNWIYSGTIHTALYNNLAPGKYVFHAKARSNTGNWSTTEKTIRITILPAWWQTWWFIGLGYIAFGLICWFGVKQYTAAKLRKQKVEFEKKKAIEQVRNRISKDIHDEIGSGLTKISLLAQRLKLGKAVREREIRNDLIEKITTTSGDVIHNLGEIIWAENPQYDNLSSLLSYFRNYINTFFEDTETAYTIDFPAEPEQVSIHPDIKRNLFLVLKETLNNLLKHSGAKNATIHFTGNDKNYCLQIEDDGKGMADTKGREFGNGMQNLYGRALQIKAIAEIQSEPGKGTIIKVKGLFY